MAICLSGYSMSNELIIDLFQGVINEDALDKLSKEELDAINKMLTEAGY